MLSQRICKGCSTAFQPHSSNHTYCTTECRLSHTQPYLARFPESLSTGTKGAILELEAAAHFMAEGYEVGRNLSPHGKADLLVWKPGHLYLVDVKSAPNHPACGPYISVICDGKWVRRVNLLNRI